MKNYLLILLLSLSFLNAQAQVDERKDVVGKFRLIPSVIVTYNPYSVYSDHVGTTKKLQFGAGIGAEYRFHKAFGVALEGNYLQQGIRLTDYGSYSSVGILSYYSPSKEYERVLRSWNVPMLLCVHPTKNDRWAIKLGYELDFLQNDKKYFKDMSQGLVFGIAHTTDFVQFELRYNKGIKDITRDTSLYHSVEKNCLSFSVGIIIL